MTVPTGKLYKEEVKDIQPFAPVVMNTDCKSDLKPKIYCKRDKKCSWATDELTRTLKFSASCINIKAPNRTYVNILINSYELKLFICPYYFQT